MVVVTGAIKFREKTKMTNQSTSSRTQTSLGSGLLLLAMLQGCSTLQTGPGKTIAETPISGASTVFERSATTFGTKLSASADDPGDSGKASEALLAGRAMLDLQCERYLDAVGSANQASTNERKQVSLIGGFAAAIMGLTGSTAKQIAGVATSFSFAGSSMDAYTTTYLFSDAAKSVTKIVRQSQNAYLTALESQDPELNYPNVVALLTGYEALCRPAQIRALIDEAIAKTTIVAEVKSPQPVDAEVGSVLSALTAALGQPISEPEAINLYAWYTNPSSRSTGAKTEVNEPIASLKKSGVTDARLALLLSQAFLPISLAGSTVPARWAPAVKQILATAVPPTPAPVPAAAAVPAPPPVAAAAATAPASAPVVAPVAAIAKATPVTRFLQVPALRAK